MVVSLISPLILFLIFLIHLFVHPFHIFNVYNIIMAESDEHFFSLKNLNRFVATWPSLSLLETHLVICTLEGNGKPFGTFVH